MRSDLSPVQRVLVDVTIVTILLILAIYVLSAAGC